MNLKTFASASFVVGTLLSAAAPAQQSANPAVLAPDTPNAEKAAPPPDNANTTDQIVLRQAAVGGMAEVELGKLAQQRAQNDSVKQFAQRMIEDHGKANSRVASLAKSRRVPLPKDVGPDEKAVRAQLEKLKGADFDAAYISAQVGDHQKTAHLLEHAIGSGQDPQTKAFAMETLPTVMAHLETAKRIQGELAGASIRPR
jgi:putative membrane protein